MLTRDVLWHGPCQTYGLPYLVWAVCFCEPNQSLASPTARAASSPFNGFPFVAPCTIECEQFDNGGPNVAYVDSDSSNNGGKYRFEQVDIYNSANLRAGQGYALGFTWPGEWLQYTTTILETGTYRIEVRARIQGSAPPSSTFHFDWNGAANVTGTMTLPNSTFNWQTITATASLTAGTGPLVLKFDSGDATYGAGLFDYITIYKAPPSFTNGGTQVTPNLVAGNDLTIAKSNAQLLQNAIDSLTNGGTINLPNGTYYICQPTPQETYPSTNGPINSPLTQDATFADPPFLRNDSSIWVGFQFTVGSTPLTVTSLGRWVVPGNSQSHLLKLVNGSDWTDVPNGLCTLSLMGATAGQFAYTNLATPVTLPMNLSVARTSKSAVSRVSEPAHVTA